MLESPLASKRARSQCWRNQDGLIGRVPAAVCLEAACRHAAVCRARAGPVPCRAGVVLGSCRGRAVIVPETAGFGRVWPGSSLCDGTQSAVVMYISPHRTKNLLFRCSYASQMLVSYLVDPSQANSRGNKLNTYVG